MPKVFSFKRDNDKFYITRNKKYEYDKISFLAAVLILVNLNHVVISFSEDLSNQNTKKNNTEFDISNLVFETGSSPFNLTYADWTAKWWQWAYSIPQKIHPAIR